MIKGLSCYNKLKNDQLQKLLSAVNGNVITDFGKDEKASSMTLLSDGKIVLAGSANTENNNGQIALAGYNTDGICGAFNIQIPDF